MSVIEINRDPSARDLQIFGLLLAVFFGLVGGIAYWRITEPNVAFGIWATGAIALAIYWLVPLLRKPMYLGWIYLAYPIGWIISHVILGATYYLLMTPIGMLIRLFGYDSMSRRFDKQADSYWKRRDRKIESSRYFKQF